jgi:hypothetical protein
LIYTKTARGDIIKKAENCGRRGGLTYQAHDTSRAVPRAVAQLFVPAAASALKLGAFFHFFAALLLTAEIKVCYNGFTSSERFF